MTFNLDEARRLHERHADYPDKCLSCGDPTEGYGVDWPCPTAVALGATGRPEWTDAPPPDPDTLRRVHIPTAGWYSIGPGPFLAHDGTTTTEVTFDTDAVTGICGADMGDGDMCPLNHRHAGEHIYRRSSHLCTTGHRLVNNMTCAREQGHGSVHVAPDGTRYSNCPNPDDTSGIIRWCTLDIDHPGMHSSWNGELW